MKKTVVACMMAACVLLPQFAVAASSTSDLQSILLQVISDLRAEIEALREQIGAEQDVDDDTAESDNPIDQFDVAFDRPSSSDDTDVVFGDSIRIEIDKDRDVREYAVRFELTPEENHRNGYHIRTTSDDDFTWDLEGNDLRDFVEDQPQNDFYISAFNPETDEKLASSALTFEIYTEEEWDRVQDTIDRLRDKIDERRDEFEVISPERGDEFSRGDSMYISWKPKDMAVATIKFVAEDGSTDGNFVVYARKVFGYDPNERGYFNTDVPYGLDVGEYRLNLTASDGTTIESDVFSVER